MGRQVFRGASAKRTAAIMALHLDGLSSIAIARRVGISRQAVCRRLIKAGISPRQERSSRLPAGLKAITEVMILQWARAYRAKHGRYPNISSGIVDGMPGLRWRCVDRLLRDGRCRRAASTTLARLLRERLGARLEAHRPALTVRQILRWADAHHRRTGAFPRYASGAIPDVPHEKWSAIDAALREGCRALPGGSSLARLLKAHGRGDGRVNARWTAEEDALVGTMPDTDVAKRLGRTVAAVRQRRAAKVLAPVIRRSYFRVSAKRARSSASSAMPK